MTVLDVRVQTSSIAFVQQQRDHAISRAYEMIQRVTYICMWDCRQKGIAEGMDDATTGVQQVRAKAMYTTAMTLQVRRETNVVCTILVRPVWEPQRPALR